MTGFILQYKCFFFKVLLSGIFSDIEEEKHVSGTEEPSSSVASSSNIGENNVSGSEEPSLSIEPSSSVASPSNISRNNVSGTEERSSFAGNPIKTDRKDRTIPESKLKQKHVRIKYLPGILHAWKPVNLLKYCFLASFV